MSFRDLIGPGKFIVPAVVQASARSGSTRYPYAAWMPIPENENQERIAPTQFVMHSMAGPRLTTIDALWHYINRSDITGESTFIDDMDGRMAQVVEANVRADNNYKANVRAVSIETQDRGYLEDPGIAITPWSDPQMAQHAGLAAWLHLRFDIPLERPVRWDTPGMDGHRAFPEWSVYVGKTCPGQARWAQIPAVLNAAREIADWKPAPPPPPPTPPPTSQEDTPMILVAKQTDGPWWVSPNGGLSRLLVSNDDATTKHHQDTTFLLGPAIDVAGKQVVGRWGSVVKTLPLADIERLLGPVAR